jgi:hypothetical protein
MYFVMTDEAIEQGKAKLGFSGSKGCSNYV